MSHNRASAILTALFFIFSVAIGNVPGRQESKRGAGLDPATQTESPNKAQPSARERGDSQQPAPPVPSQKPPAIKLDTKLVSVTVTVSDRYGRFVSGLSKDDFEIFGDEDAPVSMGIVYDASAERTPVLDASSRGRVVRDDKDQFASRCVGVR